MSQSFLCGGSVAPNRIVKQDTTTGFVVAATGATDQPIGVSQAGTHLPNLTIGGTTFDDGLAGIAVASPPNVGQPTASSIMVSTLGDVCMVEVGAAVANGDPLMASTAGVAITCTSTNWSVGRAMMNATAAGQLIRMLVEPMYYHAGGS